MDDFHYVEGALHAEQVALVDIAARFGTPCYVYSRAALARHWRAFDAAFGDHPHRICYAVKANSNLAVLNVLAGLGSDFDIVSGGELQRVLKAGGDASQVVFSGVGKQTWEIDAALAAGIGCFNIESVSELRRISAAAAKLRRVAAISVRINPDVDAKTHPYISTGRRENKFGLSAERAVEVYRQAQTEPGIRVSGVACHIGSQLTDLAPYREALRCVLDFVDQLLSLGIIVDHLDFGGGLGVRYRAERPPSPAQYGAEIVAQVRARQPQLAVAVEPGRAIVAAAGVLLTQTVAIKRGESGNFCVVDAGMNDLLRPALYQAYHDIVEVAPPPDCPAMQCDVVGPVCESADFLGKNRALKVRESDLLAVRTAGAYGAAMASNYNTRPRPAEVMVDGAACHLVRKRERIEDLYRDECVLPR